MSFDELLQKAIDEAMPKNVSRCTVRVTTTIWSDKRGLHTKKSLTFLRRQCKGFNLLEEDASTIGVEEVLLRVLNLHEVEDGIYNVMTCNESRDYETGYIDDYDYKLVATNEELTDAEKAVNELAKEEMKRRGFKL